MRDLIKFIWHIPRKIAVFLIKIYQRTLSPDHGWLKGFFPNGYCKFSPTCSSYAREAVSKYGVIRGGAKAFWRVLRCNPCSKGGVDRV